jgi:hypothetical protein
MSEYQAVSSRTLAHLIRAVIDHAGTDERSDLHAVRLESDGTYLHAVATDRLTLAVARELLDPQLNPDPKPFTALIAPRDAAHLAQIADGDENFDDGLQFTAPPDFHTRLLVSDGRPPILAAQVLVRKEGDEEYRDDACAKFVLGPDVIPYDWRELVRSCLKSELDGSAGERTIAINPHLLARWSGCEARPLHFRITGPFNPVIVTGPDFLGVQMPVKPADGESFAARYTPWIDDLRGGLKDTSAATV